MGLTNNLGKLSNMITSTGSAVGVNCTPNAQFEVLGSTGGALTDGIRVSRNTLQSSQYGVINYTSGILNLTGVNTSGGGEIRFNTSDGTTTNERMRITSAGNVGIGTSSPSYTLDVTGTGRFTSSLIAASFSTPSTGLSGSTTWNFYHDQYAAGDFGLWAGGTNRILINAAGNVGIGTSSPSFSDFSTNTLGINISNQSTNYAGLKLTGNTAYTTGSFGLYSGSAAHYLWGGGANPMIFATNDAERMRITSAGNVGISTSTPYSPLQVNGNIHRAWTSAGTTGSPASEEGFVYSEQSNSNALAGMWFENNFQSGSAVSVVFKYRSNGASVTEGMRLTAGGLLSIGTSNPYFNTPGLLVGGSGSSYFGVWQDYSGTAVGLEMTNNAGTLKIQFFGSSGNYYFAGSNISDRRAKSNIQEITEGLSKINLLKPSTFTYDKNPDIVKGGFIAQEVLEVMPEFVTIPEDENEMMGVDYFGILALAVKSIQELESRIKILENKTK